jgi:hypothetical protein
MTDESATAALKGAAEALHQSAQAHKTLEFQHRKQARKLRRQLARIEAECARRGITLEIANSTDPGRATANG